jgi:hypothetical protein
MPKEHEQKFLYSMSFGLKPRTFPNIAEYNVIYEEEEEVSEMYFITKGTVGIGFSRYLDQTSRGHNYKLCFLEGVDG